MSIATVMRWGLGLAVGLLLSAGTFLEYRWEYTRSKRLREVVSGKLYRSGQMTAAGFREAVERFHFRTIINLQDEFPDPDVAEGYFGGKSIKESELCRQMGVRYLYMPPDLIAHQLVPEHRPKTVEKFLAVMDDPAAYPVLIHCKAGLHRTGVMTAVYRMEYQNWSPAAAIEELKVNGFGEWPCTAANDYITQYILTYQPGLRERHVARGEE